MKHQTKQIKLALTSFVLLAFLGCGVMGIFCPMASSGTEPSHSQPLSHHSSSNNGDCPEQLKSSEENSKRVPKVLLPILGPGTLGSLTDHFIPRLLKSFFKEVTVTPSTYPPPFLLFSVFLN